ncbi:MAG: PAS domain S-box protein, partial [Cytophagaceae bacterium]
MTGESFPYEQDSIAAQNERLTFALEAAGVGTWDFNLLTGQAQWSAICKQLFGLPADAHITAKDLLEQVHPDDRARVDQANKQSLSPTGDGQHHIFFRTLNPEGTLRWVNAKGKTVRNDQGQVIRFSGIIQDVTQQVLSQQQIEESQRKLLASFEDSPVGIAIISAEKLTYQMVNPFYCHLVGRSPEQLVGKPLLEALPELAGQGFDRLIQKVVATRIPFIATEVAFSVIRNDKLETIYVDLTYQPRQDTGEVISSVLVVAIDVTSQVVARRAIEQSEARFRSLIEEAPVPAALLTGRELVIEFANPPQLAVWAKGNNVQGKTLAQLIPEMEGQPFLGILDDVFTTGQAYQVTNSPAELVVNGIRGTYYFDFTFKPLRNANEQVYAILAMGVDVTQQVVARQKIEESEERYRTLSVHLDQQVQVRTQQL